jgi:hypothetical protein
MKPSRARALRPRLRPLTAGLALALGSTLSVADAAPARDPLHMPVLSAAIAGRDATQLHGWHPPAVPAGDDVDALLEAWQQRPRMALPSLLLRGTGRGGTTHVVTNCNDSGPGSFRDAMGIAADNDTVDLTALTCSEITLGSGAVVAGAPNLTVTGPGSGALSIIGTDGLGLLAHIGGGTLTVDGVSLRNGRKYSDTGDIGGGCIQSSGSVTLIDTTMTECSAQTAAPDAIASGGAIRASGDVILAGSAVMGAVAENSSVVTGHERGSVGAIGGAIRAGGSVALIDSLLFGNLAVAEASMSAAGGTASTGLLSKYSTVGFNGASIGGAHYAVGTITISNSTIALNNALVAAAGVLVGSDADPVRIASSTVAGNAAQGKYALAISSDAIISNSTIAYNACTDVACTSAGIHLAGDRTLQLQSSIVAENRLANGTFVDITGPDPAPTITGANNLVTASPLALPGDTISSPPKLSSDLRTMGGPTPMLVPSGNSPALNAGNNAAAYEWDQRGPGFPRISGPAADIGAFEMDWPEYLFADDFGDD